MHDLGSYSFVVWWVFSIDTHSVLTGSGRGEFVETMLAGDLLPSPEIPTAGFSPRFSNSNSAQKTHSTPSILDFHRVILILAARLGLLAQDLRQTSAQSRKRKAQSSHAERLRRRQRVEQLRDTLRRTWDHHANRYAAMGYGNEQVPVNARGVFEHVSPSHPPEH